MRSGVGISSREHHWRAGSAPIAEPPRPQAYDVAELHFGSPVGFGVCDTRKAARDATAWIVVVAHETYGRGVQAPFMTVPRTGSYGRPIWSNGTW